MNCETIKEGYFDFFPPELTFKMIVSNFIHFKKIELQVTFL
jgi:hypothetical protein